MLSLGYDAVFIAQHYLLYKQHAPAEDAPAAGLDQAQARGPPLAQRARSGAFGLQPAPAVAQPPRLAAVFAFSDAARRRDVRRGAGPQR